MSGKKSTNVEEGLDRGGIIGIEAFTGEHGGLEFKNAQIHDLDHYNIVLGAMRRKA